MELVGELFFLVSIVLFPLAIIVLLVQTIRKKDKTIAFKMLLASMVIFFAVLLVSLVVDFISPKPHNHPRRNDIYGTAEISAQVERWRK